MCHIEQNNTSSILHQQAEDLVKQKFEFPLPDVEDQDDPLMKGEFMVMLELMQDLPGAKEGKEKVNICRQGQDSWPRNNIALRLIFVQYLLSKYQSQTLRSSLDIFDNFTNHQVDRIINLCGPGPRGTGLQNLREAIIQTKWKYDLAMEDKQVQCKLMSNYPAF